MSALLLKLGLGKVAEVVIDAVSRSGDDGEDSLPPAASAFVSAGRAFLAARGGSGAPTPEQELRGLELAVAARRAELEAASADLREVNETMREEYRVSDKYVKRWRPTWGYICAVAFGYQFIVTVSVFAFVIVRAVWVGGDVVAAVTGIGQAFSVFIGATVPLWFVAMAVLGVSVHQRSRDKAAAMGMPAEGGGVLRAFAGMTGRKSS